MKKGDIFVAEDKYKTPDTALHPIIFWKEHSNDTFIGVMVTHGKSDRFPDNIPFNDEKYYSKMENDFSNSYIVGQALVKKNEWGENYKKIIGTLSADGITLIEKEIINKSKPKWWATYLKDNLKIY